MSRPRKNPLTVVKVCPTCDGEFTISYRKKSQIYCSRHCVQNDINIKNSNKMKVKATNNIRYGGHPMQTLVGRDKFKKTILDRYGVDHVWRLESIQNKCRTTIKEKYGVENVFKSKKIRNRIKKTMLEKYGVSNIAYDKNMIKTRNVERKNKHYDYLVEYFKNNGLELMCDKVDYKGYHFKHRYNLRCNKCNTVFRSTVYNLHNVYCDICNPDKIKTIEDEFYLFLRSILSSDVIIVRNDRTILYGKELDFYIPSLKVAIELNGLYWHSEVGNNINKTYHINKTKSCAIKGIQLVHIFENEWNDRKEIIKSMISSILNIKHDIIKVEDGKCEVSEIGSKIKNMFLFNNHVLGPDKSSVKLGLFCNKELVSVMTFYKGSRFNNKYDWELMRFCNKLNTDVIGGDCKLFAYFIEKYKPKSVISYCDRRYNITNLYKNLGFEFIDHTVPSYYYILNNYKAIKHYRNFNKHKLSEILDKYDDTLTEWENMKLNGYDRIWDCGCSKWIYRNQ